jgi:hypothetical protein
VASGASNGPRSGALSSGRNKSCARSRKRYGKKPKPGRYLPRSRSAPRCPGFACSIWIELIPTFRHPV